MGTWRLRPPEAARKAKEEEELRAVEEKERQERVQKSMPQVEAWNVRSADTDSGAAFGAWRVFWRGVNQKRCWLQDVLCF